MKINTKFLSQVIYRRTILQYTRILGALGKGSLPDYIIIGTQKGGTTSLHRYLGLHPQVMKSSVKEIQFFTYRYDRGISWYKACFPDGKDRDLRSKEIGRPVVTGEASPYYIFHPDVPGRIAESIPHIKLIALLRNPVDRAISNYYHNVRNGKETLPMEEAFTREQERLSDEVRQVQGRQFYAKSYPTHSYLARGRYIEQLERYAQYFRKDQMLILGSENFYANTQSEYNKVLRFLGVEEHLLGEIKAENMGLYKKDDETQLQKQLSGYFKPYNERLYEYLGEDFGWR